MSAAPVRPEGPQISQEDASLGPRRHTERARSGDAKTCISLLFIHLSVSHRSLCGRACAAATFSVPDWLRKHLGPRKSGTRIGGFATPASPTSHSQLIQWKSGSRSRGSFSADRGRYGHGTPDAVPGDRDVAYMSISG